MSASTRTVLSALAGLGGLVTAAITFASGATLALDGTGRYALLVQVAFVIALLALASGIGLLVAAIQFARNRPAAARWARWLVTVQMILLIIALVVGSYADLRGLFYILLVLAGLVTVGLGWVVRRGNL